MQTAEQEQHDIGQLLEKHPAIKPEFVSMKDTIHGLKKYILQLEECIRHGRQKQFGASSEQVGNLHPSLFDEGEHGSGESAVEQGKIPEATVPSEASEPARATRKGPRIPP